MKDIELRKKQLNLEKYNFCIVDRGFSSKKVKDLFKISVNHSELVSPNNIKYSSKKYKNRDLFNQKLFEGVNEIYKKRWNIETVFQKMKNNKDPKDTKDTVDLEYSIKGNSSMKIENKSSNYIRCFSNV